MIKYIYKITNKINNKCYIGQTNNIARRFSEHKRYQSNENESKILYRAIEKYGIDNFSFEIIEETSNYNEREKYWIKYYNSYIGDDNAHGYNMTPGGEEPPILKGVDNYNTTHSLEQVQQVKNLLQNSDLSTVEIGKITNYSQSAIERINKGIIWFDDELTYPLRKMSTVQEHKDIAKLIIYDLKNTNLTQKEIAEKYGLGRTAITAINLGENCRQENEKYPIRSNRITKTPYKEIIVDLLNSDLKSAEIARKYNVSASTVCDINKGRKYKQENLIYPLRK